MAGQTMMRREVDMRKLAGEKYTNKRRVPRRQKEYTTRKKLAPTEQSRTRPRHHDSFKGGVSAARAPPDDSAPAAPIRALRIVRFGGRSPIPSQPSKSAIGSTSMPSRPAADSSSGACTSTTSASPPPWPPAPPPKPTASRAHRRLTPAEVLSSPAAAAESPVPVGMSCVALVPVPPALPAAETPLDRLELRVRWW